MFSRQRDPGLWTFDAVVEDHEFEYFDESISNAIDGLNGGAYSLQSPLILGGAPGASLSVQIFTEFDATVFMNGDLFVHGNGDFTGAGTTHTFGGDFFDINSGIVTLGTTGADAFTVESFTNFNSQVNLNGSVFLFGPADLHGIVEFHDVVTLDGSVTISNVAADFAVYSGARFFNVVNLESDVVANGNVTLGDSSADVVVIKGASQIQAPLTFAGTGGIVERQTIGNDSDQTFLAVNQSHVHVPAGVLTETRTYKIDFTGAPVGSRVRFSNMDVTQPVLIKTTGGATITAVVSTSGSRFWCDVELFPGGFLRVSGAGTA